MALDEIDVLLSTAAPVLIRLAAIEGAPFLAVLGVAVDSCAHSAATCASIGWRASGRQPPIRRRSKLPSKPTSSAIVESIAA